MPPRNGGRLAARPWVIARQRQQDATRLADDRQMPVKHVGHSLKVSPRGAAPRRQKRKQEILWLKNKCVLPLCEGMCGGKEAGMCVSEGVCGEDVWV